jgi:hypothetical protein
MRYIATKDDFTFARKVFIKDLFEAKGIINSFKDITFLTYHAFAKFIAANLFLAQTYQRFTVRVATREDIENIVQLLQSTDLEKNVDLTLEFPTSLAEDIFDLITDQKIGLSSTYETSLQLINQENPRLANYLYWTKFRFTAANYAEEYEKLVKLALADARLNFVDLTVNYASFEAAPLSELHKLQFYMNQLKIWLTRAPLTTGSPPRIITLKNNGDWVLRCFIDDDLNIRFNETEVYFELSKYLISNGENLQGPELNQIRKIIDIGFETKITNRYLIDLDQNYKVMGDYYRIPYLTTMICEWLGLTTQHAETSACKE